MRAVPGLILRDPSLRMVAGGVFLFGTFSASLGIHQSLIAVRVFGLTDPEYAVVLFLAMAVSVTASVGIGIVSDQQPRRKAMAVLSAAAGVLGPLLVWATDRPLAFVLAHILLMPVAGTLFGQFFALARLASSRYAPAERDGILAVLRALFAVPFTLVLPLWGLAFRDEVPLITIYPAIGLVAAALLALILRDWPHDSRAPWREDRSGLSLRAALGEIASGPVMLRTVLMGAVQAGGAISGIVLGLLFARAGRGAGDLGLFFGLFVVVEIAGTLLAGMLARHVPRLWLIASGVATYALFLALLPFLAGTRWLWLLILPAGAGGALIYTLAIAYLQDLLHARPGAGASLIAIQRVSAEGLSTAIYGFGAWAQGYATVSLLGAVATLTAMGMILRLDRGGLRPGRSSVPPRAASGTP
ncbi:MFS transporter [Rubellimicrobium arenae]|uniref:MFS transporter n=1 Tax=Rubellimicrobium arenae TaxID=2817372 RepID=UPI001B315BBF|nr:MFS transporter [Rubellimicrobium arenae]